jgi:DNA-binding NarL/FixJ family response regulator
MTIRVLIADDHAVVRQGLRIFLECDPDLETVGEATNGSDALRLARELRPDLVLMDLIMPGLDGIEATALLRQELPDVEVLTLTCMASDDYLFAAMQAGAIGYLLKTTQAPALCQAIKAAAAGQIQLSPEAAARLLEGNGTPKGRETLTEREKDILRFLAKGCSNKAIARALDIGVQTVKSHVAHVLNKLGVSSRTQAVLRAMQAGLVPGVGLASASRLAAEAPAGSGQSIRGTKGA